MKHSLRFSKEIEKILIAGYLDDLITMNSTHSFCCNIISKITLLLSKLGFVIHPEKSTFNTCQEIKYLGFLINSIKMTVLLIPDEKILPLCVKFLATEQVPERQVAQLLRHFSRSSITVPYGKLYNRSPER